MEDTQKKAFLHQSCHEFLLSVENLFMLSNSSAILWLQRNICYVFEVHAATSGISLWKSYPMDQEPRCVAQDLSQTDFASVQIYYAQIEGYLVPGNQNFTKQEWITALNKLELYPDDDDLIRCQNLGQNFFIQLLPQETLQIWQNAMRDYHVNIDLVDFPEQSCLNLMPDRIKKSGFRILLADLNGQSYLNWTFAQNYWRVEPISFVYDEQFLNQTDLPLLVNKNLLTHLVSEKLSDHGCPIYSLEEVWEMKFGEDDLQDARAGFLLACYKSPVSIRALQPWGRTIFRMGFSVFVLIMLLRLATPKVEQQYALVTNNTLQNNTPKLSEEIHQSGSQPSVPLSIKNRLDNIWSKIEGMKNFADKISSHKDEDQQQSSISYREKLIHPVLNYTQQIEMNRCGEFQLGLQKLQLCLNQELMGRVLKRIDTEKSIWIDEDNVEYQIPRVTSIKAIQTKIIQISSEDRYLIELLSENSLSMIVDSWEGQVLKSRAEAEVLAEAISAGIISKGRIGFSSVARKSTSQVK